MANITVSASNNFDASANQALNNGETITLNTGAVLTMNSDNRWSQNAAVPLNITIDAASGGELLMDGRDVWWLPFSAGSGTVPVLGTTFPAASVTSATASGEFLGVFTGLGVAPSSGTMPATGFIKLRAKTGNFANAQALSLPGGATATASGAGQRGWLNIVGAETGTITIPRLGKWTARGDWFDLATTSGSRDQTIQYYVADYCPALWIETSAGSGVYEIWLNAGARWSATFVSMDERGKFFGCSAAGVITLAATGFGKLPAAGCKIRVPNIHISSTTSANYALNTLNASMSSRWKVSTDSSGTVDLRNASGVFYLNCGTPYAVNLSYVSVLHGIYLATPATSFAFDNVAVGLASTFDICPLQINSAPNGGLVLDSKFIKYTSGNSSGAGVYVNVANEVTFSSVFSGGFARSGIQGASFSVVGPAYDLTLEGCTGFGAQLNATASNRMLIKDWLHTDSVVGGVITTNQQKAISLTQCDSAIVDGVSLMTNGTPAYLGIVEPSQGTKVRNIGSPTALYDCASHCSHAINPVMSNLAVQRVYLQNTRTGLIANSSSMTSSVTLESFWGDATDVVPYNAKDLIVKGGYGGSGLFGAADGIFTNISSVYGANFYDTFISATQGRIGCYFNEASVASSSYVTASGAIYDATGRAYLQDLSDQLTYTWPHFILGYTGLANVAPALSGTNTGNLTIEYDLDKGAGFSGTWQTCIAANLSAETGISATTGFKPKFRFTCATASTSNAINGFYITGTTDASSQQTQYPLDVSTLTLTGLPVAAEVRCYTGAKDGSAVEIGGVEATGGTTFTFTHSSGGSSGFIHIIHPSYKIKEIDYTYAVADTELLIQMDPDPWYSNPV